MIFVRFTLLTAKRTILAMVVRDSFCDSCDVYGAQQIGLVAPFVYLSAFEDKVLVAADD